jgi:hypothetical protein
MTNILVNCHDAYSLPSPEDQLRMARGVIVIATFNPKDRPIAVPIFEPPTHSPAFQDDWKVLKKELKKCGKKGRPSRLAVLASMFEESWQTRVGADWTSDPTTIGNFILFGNAILDEVPGRHIVLVTIAERVKIFTPSITDRDEFLAWKNDALPDEVQALFNKPGKSPIDTHLGTPIQ